MSDLIGLAYFLFGGVGVGIFYALAGAPLWATIAMIVLGVIGVIEVAS